MNIVEKYLKIIMIKKFLFVSLLVFSVFASKTLAGEVWTNAGDSLYSEKDDFRRRTNIDANKYIQQKRYRPDYSKFQNKRFLNNSEVGLYGGLFGFVPPTEMAKFRSGNVFGITAGKYVSPCNVIRIGVSRSQADRIFDNQHWLAYGANIDHLFNVSTFLKGYERSNLFEFFILEGLGYYYTKMDLLTSHALNAHIGAQFRLNAGRRLSVYVEPRFDLYSDNIDQTSNWHSYDLGYSAMLGLNYRLGSSKSMESARFDKFASNTFVSFSGGLQSQISDATMDMGLWRAAGTHMTASYGKWLTNMLALRLSVFGSYMGWKENGKYHDFLAMYGGGRFEFMFDPFIDYSTGKKKNLKFSVIPVAGIEVGMSARQGVPAEQSEYLRMFSYTGFTGGLQFKYQLQDDVALYLEPRYSGVPYFYGFKNYLGYIEGYNFIDNLVSLNLGVELQNWGAMKSGVNKVPVSQQKKFVPHFFLSTQFGGAWAVQMSRAQYRTRGHVASVSMGYQFNKVSGLDGMLETGTISTRSLNISRQIEVTAAMHYLMDVDNLLIGYDPQRRWGVTLLGGPVVTKVSRNTSNKPFFIGLEGGGRFTYDMSELIELYLEPKFRCYTSRVFPTGTGTPGLAQFTLGSVYRFGHKGWRSRVPEDGDRLFKQNWFIGASLGATTTWGHTVSLFKGNGNFLNSLGPAFSFNVGKWVTPFWALRGSVTGTYYMYTTGNGKVPGKIYAHAGARAEAMFNPFRLVRDRNFRVELVPMGGIEAGMNLRQKPEGGVVRGFYTGLTVAAQLRFNTNSQYVIYLEPRATRMPTSYMTGKKETLINDNLLSLSIGAELGRPVKVVRNRLKGESETFMRHYYVSLGGGLASQISTTRYNTIKMTPNFEIYGGWQFTPSSGVRAGIDYTQLASKKDKTVRANYTSFSVNYTLALANFFAGYNSNRRFDIDLFLGPVCTWANEKTYFGAEGGFRGLVNINKDFAVYIQPKGRLYRKNILPSSFRQSSPAIFSLSAGVTYKF